MPRSPVAGGYSRMQPAALSGQRRGRAGLAPLLSMRRGSVRRGESGGGVGRARLYGGRVPCGRGRRAGRCRAGLAPPLSLRRGESRVGNRAWESGKPDSTGTSALLPRASGTPAVERGLPRCFRCVAGNHAWESGEPDSTGRRVPSAAGVGQARLYRDVCLAAAGVGQAAVERGLPRCFPCVAGNHAWESGEPDSTGCACLVAAGRRGVTAGACPDRRRLRGPASARGSRTAAPPAGDAVRARVRLRPRNGPRPARGRAGAGNRA